MSHFALVRTAEVADDINNVLIAWGVYRDMKKVLARHCTLLRRIIEKSKWTEVLATHFAAVVGLHKTTSQTGCQPRRLVFSEY